MMAEEIRSIVQLRIGQADETLRDAQLLFEQGGSARSVVNRAYYAAFYAVLALLQTIGKAPSKHSGAIALFDSEFVRSGMLDKDCSRKLHRLFEARQEDDYRSVKHISCEDAFEALGNAETFLQRVHLLLLQLLQS